MASDFFSKLVSFNFSDKFRRFSEGSMRSTGPLPARARRRRAAFGAFHFKREKTLKQLETAIDQGDVTTIEEIAEMVGIPELEEDHVCYVLKACEKGNLDVVSTLLRHGASINSLGDSNYAPLHIAVKKNNNAMVAILISAGANVDVHTKYERKSPLQVAAMEGHLTIVELLLANGADINDRDLYGGQALHIACRMDRKKIVATLLTYHAQIDSYDNQGWTGLHLASQAGHSSLVKYLLQCHANVDCQSKYGRTSLHWACASGHLAVVNELLHGSANANIRDLHDKLALDYAQNEKIRTLVKIHTEKPGMNKTFVSTIGLYIQIDPRHQNQDNEFEQAEAAKTKKWLSADCVTDASHVTRLSEADLQAIEKRHRARECQKHVSVVIYGPEGNAESYSSEKAEETDVISNTFKHLVYSTNGAIASLAEAFQDFYSVMAIASEPKTNVSRETIDSAILRLSSVQQELENFERNFQVESDNFLSVLQRDARSSPSYGAPSFVALVVMFTESLLDVLSNQSDSEVWKTFLKALKLEQETEALLSIRLQLDHESSVRDKLKHCLLFWARSIDVGGDIAVNYMKTLLQSIQTCSGINRTGDDMINDILQNFIKKDVEFRTGSQHDKIANLSLLVQSLQAKESRMLLHSLEDSSSTLNLFPGFRQLDHSESMSSDISQMAEHTAKRRQQEDEDSVYKRLKDIIEQEDVSRVTTVVKFLILCGREDLISFLL